MGYLAVLGLAVLDFFEAVKVVTLRLRLSCHHLGSSPFGTSRLRDFHFMTPRSKTPQLRLRRTSETWLALRLNARQDIRVTPKLND